MCTNSRARERRDEYFTSVSSFDSFAHSRANDIHVYVFRPGEIIRACGDAVIEKKLFSWETRGDRENWVFS